MKEFFKANYLLFIKIILTIYSLYSLKYLFKLKHIESEFYMNLTFLFIIAAVYLLINYGINKLKNGIDKRLLIISIIMSLYFAFVSVLGAYYEGAVKGERYAEVLDFTFNNFVISLKYIPALLFLFLSAVLFIFLQIPKVYNNYISPHENYNEMPKIFNKLYKIWFFIFICWLPYFILLYPGYVGPDAEYQIYQFNTGNFNTHHPIIYSFYMFFIHIYYKLSNNGILSIAVYVLIFQMLFFSFVYAYMINKLNKLYNINKIIIIFVILFIALYPVFPVVSITLEKGLLFTIIFILFLVKLIEVSEDTSLLRNKKFIIQLVIIGIFLCLTRNNAIYGLILVIPFMLFFAKGYRKYILISFAGIFIGYMLLNTALIKIIHAEKGEFRESMSMPIQQLARVYKYHKDSLTKDEINFIIQMVNNKDVLNSYHPKLSDNVKNDSKTQYFLSKEFITEYIKLGLKYPGTYLNSFLIMSSSLWYPFENSFWNEGIFIGIVNVHTLNIKVEDQLEHKNKFINNYIRNNQFGVHKNNTMALFVLVNQGFLFYFFIFSFMYFIYKRLYKYNLILLIPLGYTATLLLGPVIYFRYTYFLAVLIPMLIMMLTNRNNNMVSLNNEK